ncbi:MAG: hypothetical protein HY662_04210 [Chloroflexi bacterium]|nr:hypothetical protein [Chloroflexota bacterium]
MRTKYKFWLFGLLLAAIGILLARVMVNSFEPVAVRLTVYLLGVTLALAGLGVIMYGMRKTRTK